MATSSVYVSGYDYGTIKKLGDQPKEHHVWIDRVVKDQRLTIAGTWTPNGPRDIWTGVVKAYNLNEVVVYVYVEPGTSPNAGSEWTAEGTLDFTTGEFFPMDNGIRSALMEWVRGN